MEGPITVPTAAALDGGTGTGRSVKLCVHFIANGQYWKEGDEIPDSEVPERIRKYEVKRLERILDRQE